MADCVTNINWGWLMRSLLPIFSMLTVFSTAYATEDRVARTFQVIKCDDENSGSPFRIVPVYFGTYSASPNIQFDSVLAPHIIPSPGYDQSNQPEWNVATYHGVVGEYISYDHDDKAGSSITVTIDLENFGKPPGSWCPKSSVMAGVIKAFQCVAKDQSTDTLHFKIKSPDAKDQKLFGRSYEIGKNPPDCPV
jgi:hypothetical protein